MGETDHPGLNRPLEAGEEARLVALLGTWLGMAGSAEGPAIRCGEWTFRLAQRLPDGAAGLHMVRDGPSGIGGVNLRAVAWDAAQARAAMADIEANYRRLVAATTSGRVEWQERRRRRAFREALRMGRVGGRLREYEDESGG